MMGGKGKEDKMSRESAGVSWLLGGSRSVLRLGGDLRVERLPCPPESRPSRLCLWYFSKPWETLKAFYLGVDTLQTGEGYLQGGRHINRGLIDEADREHGDKRMNAELAQNSSQKLTVHISSQVHIQWCHSGSLQLQPWWEYQQMLQIR